MSELRDIARAVAAHNSILVKLCELAAAQEGHAKQLRDSMHNLRADVQALSLGLPLIHETLGELKDALKRIEIQQELLRQDVVTGFRNDRGRIRDLENGVPHDEKTQP